MRADRSGAPASPRRPRRRHLLAAAVVVLAVGLLVPATALAGSPSTAATSTVDADPAPSADCAGPAGGAVFLTDSGFTVYQNASPVMPDNGVFLNDTAMYFRNVTLRANGPASMRLEDGTGSTTCYADVDASRTTVSINPDGEPRVDVDGQVAALSLGNATINDTDAVDLAYNAASSWTIVWYLGAPVNTTAGAVDVDTGTALANETVASDGTLTVTVPAGEHAVALKRDPAGQPVADAGANQTVDEDKALTFDASGSADNGVIVSYDWDVDDDGVDDIAGDGPAYTYTDPGKYTVTLTVDDDSGNTDTDTLVVTVIDTTAPTADAGPDRTVDEDVAVGFDASGSTDNVGVTSYAWNFGDGNTSTGAAPSHTYVQPGNYTVTLTVSDAAGNTDTDSLVVPVRDTTSPTAVAGANRTVDEDTLVAFDGTTSTDNVGIVSYEWDVDGDTTPDATGPQSAHTYTSPGTYTVTLTVSDAAGNTDTDTVVMTVIDTTAPVADAGPDRTVDEDVAVSFDATASTDNVGIVSYEWDVYGDGSTDATGPVASHTYVRPGTYTVTLSVTDAAGNTATDAVTVITDLRVDVDRPERTGAANETRTMVTVTNAPVNETLVLTGSASGSWVLGVDDSVPDAPPLGALENVTLDQLELTVTRRVDYGLNVSVAEVDAPVRDGSPIQFAALSPRSQAFVRATGATPLGHVTVDHTVADADVAEVTFRFEVRKTYLSGLGVSPDAVTLSRERGGWQALPTRQVGENGSHYSFVATAPGLSRFTIGATAAVFELQASDVSADHVEVGDTVSRTATVENVGQADGTYSVDLTVNGRQVATETVSVTAGGSRTVTLTAPLENTGTHAVAIDGQQVGTVTVSQGTPVPTVSSTTDSSGSSRSTTTTDTTTAPDGALMRPVVTILLASLLALMTFRYYRRRTKGGGS